MENLEAALPEDQANKYAQHRVIEEGSARSEREINKIRQAFIPSIRVAYFRNIGSYGISDGIDHSIASIRHRAQKCGLWHPDSKLIGASWDSNRITPNRYCKYDACLQIVEDFQADHRMSIQRIPAGEYAIYRTAYQSSGEIALIWREFTQCIRSRRFSAYRMSSKPCFEIFCENPLTGQPEIELYVRLDRKQSTRH
jgi:DNA gyrase inhibitor GyrI